MADLYVACSGWGMNRASMSVTAKGKRWETLHSLWIGWTFTLFLGWLAFVYIGLRARRPRWALWGLVYLFPLVLPSIIGINYTELSQWHWTETLALLVWVASIIHASIDPRYKNWSRLLATRLDGYTSSWKCSHPDDEATLTLLGCFKNEV